MRTDTGGCSKAFLRHITEAGSEVLHRVRRPRQRSRPPSRRFPEQAWRAAVDGDGEPRQGAQVAELTAWLPARASSRPEPARTGRPGCASSPAVNDPIPAPQLRLTDHNGWRITCFATNTPPAGQDGDSRTSRSATANVRAAEDRIRGLKDTGLRNLPFHGYDQNRIWLEIVALEPTCWPGPRPLPSTNTKRPDAGNPENCTSGSSPSPAASSEPDDADDCDYP